MKIFIKILLILLLGGIISLSSCFKADVYPPEPQIEFIDFTFHDSIKEYNILKGVLHFSFIDGDGNVGFGTGANSPKTVFINKYKIENNIPVKIELDDEIINYKVPEFSTSGNRKYLKGEIIINSLDELAPINSNDTIMYEFYIIDRDYNESNTENTGYLIPGDYLKNEK